MHKCRWNVKSLPTLAHVPNTNCGGGRKSKVEQAESEHRKSKQQRERQRKPHTPRSQPCCSQGYAHCPRALHHQPLPPSTLLCRPCACRHQRSTPPALLCAMPRTRPREPPTLQRTARERDWVLRRVEVCDLSLTTAAVNAIQYTRHPFPFPSLHPATRKTPPYTKPARKRKQTLTGD